ncbi:MAG: peptidyl-prolyl cis-trans isomerase [Candidatus Handelsmanbacteria bacterium]|nr:peptidyl-prolyl cis-trans isomerase [Candidatus Handelsmanbacteria bacterium]
MKRIAILCLGAGLLAAPLAWGQEDVARIGERTLSAAQYAQRAQRMLRQGYGDLKVLDQAAKLVLLDGMVSQELLILEGLARGLDHEPEIAEEAQRAAQRVLIDSLYARQALQGEYVSTEEEERRLFTERRYHLELHSQQLVCPTQAQAQEALAALRAGESFASLVPRYSTPRIQRRFGPEGDIGWYKLPDLLPELREPLLALEEGGLCEEPVKSALGYHVFRLKGRREVPFAQARELMGKLVREQKAIQDKDRYVQQLRRQYELRADEQALARLQALPADQKEWPGPDEVLFTWTEGRITAAGYLERHRQGKARHPSSYDLEGLYKAVDNMAGQQIMMAEARRLGHDRDPLLRDQIESRRNELMAEALFRSEGVAEPVGEAQERAYYQENLEKFTQPDGKATPFAQLQKSIHTFLVQRQESQSMDRFIASLRQNYQVQVFPEVLEGIEIQR